MTDGSLISTDLPPPEVGASIAVALIEDNRLVREALSLLLNRFPDIEVVAAEETVGDELPPWLVRPDVVMLDLGLENGDSLRLVQQILEADPDAKIIVMDLLPDYEEITEFVSAGVSGFLLKDATLKEVARTIRAVAAGTKVLPEEMAGTLFSEIARQIHSTGGSESDDGVRLTPREREVIDLISEGLSNKAIAKRLFISTYTVKSHLRNVMEKLTLHTRLQLAAYAHRQGNAD